MILPQHSRSLILKIFSPLQKSSCFFFSLLPRNLFPQKLSLHINILEELYYTAQQPRIQGKKGSPLQNLRGKGLRSTISATGGSNLNSEQKCQSSEGGRISLFNQEILAAFGMFQTRSADFWFLTIPKEGTDNAFNLLDYLLRDWQNNALVVDNWDEQSVEYHYSSLKIPLLKDQLLNTCFFF